MLSFFLDSVNEAYTDETFLSAMDYADAQAWSHYAQACNEADNAELPDLSDLTMIDHTLPWEERLFNDYNLLCEYYDDTEDVAGFGVIRDYKVDAYLDGVDTEFAYIETPQGGRTYAKVEYIVPIANEESHVSLPEPTNAPMRALPVTDTPDNAVSGEWDSLRALPLFNSIATFIGLEAVS